MRCNHSMMNLHGICFCRSGEPGFRILGKIVLRVPMEFVVGKARIFALQVVPFMSRYLLSRIVVLDHWRLARFEYTRTASLIGFD
jgi:hypothetical protein